VYNGPEDFDIMTIRYPITKKSGDLGVILYYRGGQYPIKVSVYATLLKVEATPSLNFWPDPTWDNDVDNGLGGPLQLSKQIEVKALYAAINNSEDQEYKTLTYWYDPSVKDPYKTGPYYLFAGVEDTDDEDEADPMEPGGPSYSGDSTYAKGYQKYLNNGLKNKETTTNVTVRHTISAYTESDDTKYIHNNGVIDNNDNGTLFSCGIANWYEVVFKGRYEDWRMKQDDSDSYDPWTDHDRGMLPNGWSPYNPDQKKVPWGYIYIRNDRTHAAGEVVTTDGVTPKTNSNVRQNPSRDFGPKLNQSKKFKIAVTWTSAKG